MVSGEERRAWGNKGGAQLTEKLQHSDMKAGNAWRGLRSGALVILSNAERQRFSAPFPAQHPPPTG